MTRLQRDLLKFIAGYQRDNWGMSPSFQEMADGLRLKSKSGVHRMLGTLEQQGFIRRYRNSARSVELIRLPPSEPRSVQAALADVITVPVFTMRSLGYAARQAELREQRAQDLTDLDSLIHGERM